MAVVFIGIGSNLGDRSQNIDQALSLLKSAEGIILEAVSSVKETASVGAPGPDYLNAVAKLACELTPLGLLAVLQDIEDRLGRTRPFKNAPRTIDLDILLYGEDLISSPILRVPHPRMFERDFVMEPLLEIEPGIAGIIDKMKEGFNLSKI